MTTGDSDDEWDPMRVVWASVDSDGSGTLGREELREVLAQMGRFVTEEQLTATMDQVDFDGSGEVEYDEFEKWCEIIDDVFAGLDPFDSLRGIFDSCSVKFVPGGRRQGSVSWRRQYQRI